MELRCAQISSMLSSNVKTKQKSTAETLGTQSLEKAKKNIFVGPMWDLCCFHPNLFKSETLECLLFKAMNGLRRAPFCFYQLPRTVYSRVGEKHFWKYPLSYKRHFEETWEYRFAISRKDTLYLNIYIHRYYSKRRKSESEMHSKQVETALLFFSGLGWQSRMLSFGYVWLSICFVVCVYHMCDSWHMFAQVYSPFGNGAST